MLSGMPPTAFITFLVWTISAFALGGAGKISSEACPLYAPYYCTCSENETATLMSVRICPSATNVPPCLPCPIFLQDQINCTCETKRKCPLCSEKYFGPLETNEFFERREPVTASYMGEEKIFAKFAKDAENILVLGAANSSFPERFILNRDYTMYFMSSKPNPEYFNTYKEPSRERSSNSSDPSPFILNQRNSEYVQSPILGLRIVSSGYTKRVHTDSENSRYSNPSSFEANDMEVQRKLASQIQIPNETRDSILGKQVLPSEINPNKLIWKISIPWYGKALFRGYINNDKHISRKNFSLAEKVFQNELRYLDTIYSRNQTDKMRVKIFDENEENRKNWKLVTLYPRKISVNHSGLVKNEEHRSLVESIKNVSYIGRGSKSSKESKKNLADLYNFLELKRKTWFQNVFPTKNTIVLNKTQDKMSHLNIFYCLKMNKPFYNTNSSSLQAILMGFSCLIIKTNSNPTFRKIPLNSENFVENNQAPLHLAPKAVKKENFTLYLTRHLTIDVVTPERFIHLMKTEQQNVLRNFKGRIDSSSHLKRKPKTESKKSKIFDSRCPSCILLYELMYKIGFNSKQNSKEVSPLLLVIDKPEIMVHDKLPFLNPNASDLDNAKLHNSRNEIYVEIKTNVLLMLSETYHWLKIFSSKILENTTWGDLKSKFIFQVPKSFNAKEIIKVFQYSPVLSSEEILQSLYKNSSAYGKFIKEVEHILFASLKTFKNQIFNNGINRFVKKRREPLLATASTNYDSKEMTTYKIETDQQMELGGQDSFDSKEDLKSVYRDHKHGNDQISVGNKGSEPTKMAEIVNSKNHNGTFDINFFEAFAKTLIHLQERGESTKNTGYLNTKTDSDKYQENNTFVKRNLENQHFDDSTENQTKQFSAGYFEAKRNNHNPFSEGYNTMNNSRNFVLNVAGISHVKGVDSLASTQKVPINHNTSKLRRRRSPHFYGIRDDREPFRFTVYDAVSSSRSKRSNIPQNTWCSIRVSQRNGNLDCFVWSYKKECNLNCHPGYAMEGKTTYRFNCDRRANEWVPLKHAFCSPDKNGNPTNDDELENSRDDIPENNSKPKAISYGEMPEYDEDYEEDYDDYH